jgi:hypothetical protein
VSKYMSAVITLEMILDAKACPEQVTLFNKLHPLGFALVTPKSVLSAKVDGIDIYWAGEKLLRGEFKRSYNAALAEPRKVYDAALTEVGKVYDAAKAEAHRAYYAALVEPHKVYTSARSEARKVYYAAMAEAGKAFDTALVQAFSDAFNAQCRAEVVA